MRVVVRLLAVIGLVVSVVGFVGFIGAAVSVWKLKTETNQRTDALAGQAHTAIGAADRAVGFVRDVIAQSQKELNNARDESPAPQRPVNPFVQLSARRASENLAGSVERANAALVTASDAAVVAEAALNVFGEDEQMKELKAWLGVKPEQLAQTKTDLGNATRELHSVRTILGVPVDGRELTAEQLVTVESALNQAGGFTEQMGKVVAQARTQVDETKRTVDLWVLRVALGVTLVGVLGAAGQFFMARFCWRVLRGKPA